MLKEKLETKVKEAIEKAIKNGELGELKASPDNVAIELPKNPDHGDRAVSVAMRLTKEAKIPPRNIAEAIKSNIDSSGITAIDIAGPGFINLRLDWNSLEEIICEINTQKEHYASFTDKNKPEPGIKSVLLEYVSANPTGDLHLGHGRQAVLGSALSNLLKKTGYKVEDEFYINDAGAQIEKLGKSAKQANLIKAGVLKETDYDTENNYPLDSMMTILEGGDLIDTDIEACDEAEYGDKAKKIFIKQQQEILKEARVVFNTWYSEKDNLHQKESDNKTKVEKANTKLLEKGTAYEEDGALWFKAEDYGDERNRVLKKQNGKFTYLAADLAYHQNKIDRGFDKLINLWGADHHGQIAGMNGILEASGYDSSKLEVVLMQMVSLARNGEEFKMSKRSGDFVTISDLIAEVGVDAFRYFLVESQANNRVVFDLELATKQDKDNPVYYIQYAHARLSSILRNISEERMNTATQKTEPAILSKGELETWLKEFESNQDLFNKNFNDLNDAETKSTKNLILFLAQYPDMLFDAALGRAPNKVAHYLKELASLFHQFYTHNRVISDNKDLVKARLSIVSATKAILKDGLDILGISAPEKM